MATRAKSKPRAKSNGVPPIPNALSKQDRVAAVANALLALQRQALELDINQTANGHSDDDLIPGMPAGPNGEPPTYKMRRKVFKDGQLRLAAQHRDLMPQVRGYIAGVHAQQDAQ